MAGSYSHAVADDGQLLANEEIFSMLENGGDIYECLEEMFGMIWYLANGSATKVERARQNYREGLAVSPGTDGHNDNEEEN